MSFYLCFYFVYKDIDLYILLSFSSLLKLKTNIMYSGIEMENNHFRQWFNEKLLKKK